MSSPFPFLPSRVLDMTSHKIINVDDPTSAQDAATKNYVDTNSLSNALTSAHIFVGNGSNIATDVALSGDASLSNTGALTLATVNSNVGSFGSASSVGAFTVNAKGLVTAASSTSIQIAESQVTNLVSDLAAKLSNSLTSAHIFVGNGSNIATNVAASGDLSLANTGAFSIVATSNATLVTLSALSLPASQISGVLSEIHGGTNQSSYVAGDILYASATDTLSKLPIGSDGDVLTVVSGLPAYAAPSSSGANVFLSNLSSPTAINQDLIFSKGSGFGPGADAFLKTQDSSAGGRSGVLTLQSGTGGSTFSSGNVLLKSGNTASASSGSLQLRTGSVSTNGSGGNITIQPGSGAGGGVGGSINIESGNGSAGGNITVTSNGGMFLSAQSAPGGISLSVDAPSIVFQDSTQGTAGYSWQSIDTAGTGSWIAPSASSGPLRVATGDDTLDPVADRKVVYNAGAGAFNITLPPATQNMSFIIVQAAANSGSFTIVPDGADLLDSNIQAIFNANEPVEITYNVADTTWYPV